MSELHSVRLKTWWTSFMFYSLTLSSSVSSSTSSSSTLMGAPIPWSPVVRLEWMFQLLVAEFVSFECLPGNPHHSFLTLLSVDSVWPFFVFFCGLLLVNSYFKEMVCFRSVQVRTIDADMHQWIEYSVFQRALSLYSFYSTCTTLWPRITYRHGKSLLLQLYVQWLAWVLCEQSYQGELINKFLLNLNSLHLMQRSSTCGT